MKKKKYLIMTQSYDENCGGYVVLHKLCDQVNRLGREPICFRMWQVLSLDEEILLCLF